MARYLEQNQIVSQSAASAETYTVANNNQFSGQLSQRQEKGELGLGGNSSPPPPSYYTPPGPQKTCLMSGLDHGDNEGAIVQGKGY